MHPSSFDKMSAFVREYLGGRTREPLLILDLGSADVNGSFRSLFVNPDWRYLGVDLVPARNVDLVLRDPYVWREVKSGSVDVVISGQMFEHTDFFWASFLEISRVLKRGGLVCVIVPSAGPEHRYPRDCWRMFPDGLSSLAQYAGLQLVECWRHSHDLPNYDDESNKWHESVLIARLDAVDFPTRVRCGLQRLLFRYFPLSALPRDAAVQVFYSVEGVHREENSISGRIAAYGWQTLRVPLPESIGATQLRIDLVVERGIAEIETILLRSGTNVIFRAGHGTWEGVRVLGDAERLPSSQLLRLRITGADPQLHLPPVEFPAAETRYVEMRLQIAAR